MLLISEKAEIEFLEQLKEIKAQKALDKWKCIICGLDVRYYKEPQLKADLCRLINMSDLSHRNIMIFWLATGYIIVLCQSTIEPVFKTLKSLIEMYVNKDGHTLIPPRIIDLHKDVAKVEKAILTPITSVKNKSTQTTPIPEMEIETAKLAGDVDTRGIRRKRFKPTLLSIEDDRTTARIIKHMMSPYCDVVAAENAEEANKLYDEILPNIVFMDIELPDGNGKDLTAEITARDPEAFIVMVSGHLKIDIIDECIMKGARGFIAKPVNNQLNRLLYFVNLYNSENRYSVGKKHKAESLRLH